MDLSLSVETSCIGGLVSSLPPSLGSRQCNFVITADIFVAAGVNINIQVTIMLNVPQHQTYLHPDVGAEMKHLYDKIKF